MKITVMGIDLAKRVFQLHGVDERGQVRLRKKLSCNKLLEFLAQLPACLIGRLGHEVRLIPSQYVKPYVKTNKNDYNDAEAICEAVGSRSTTHL